MSQSVSYLGMGLPVFFSLFYLILYLPTTIFQLKRDGSSWVEPALSQDNSVTPVRPEPAALQSLVKHSTTELPLAMGLLSRKCTHNQAITNLCWADGCKVIVFMIRGMKPATS